MLKPLDLTMACYLASADLRPSWTQTEVARALGISQSMVHRSLAQLRRSALLIDDAPRREPLRDVLVHAARYIYPPELGPPARGVPTAHSAPEFTGVLSGPGHDVVWPSDYGSGYGTGLEPLHSCVPAAALEHPRFYEFMSLVEVLRIGRVREVHLAIERLDTLLGVAA